MTLLRWIFVGGFLLFSLGVALFLVSFVFARAFVGPFGAAACLGGFAALSATSASAITAGLVRWRRKVWYRTEHASAYWALLLVYLAGAALYLVAAAAMLDML